MSVIDIVLGTEVIIHKILDQGKYLFRPNHC